MDEEEAAAQMSEELAPFLKPFHLYSQLAAHIKDKVRAGLGCAWLRCPRVITVICRLKAGRLRAPARCSGPS